MRELGHQRDDVDRAADNRDDVIDRSVLDDVAGDNHFDRFVRLPVWDHAPRAAGIQKRRSFGGSGDEPPCHLPAGDGRAVAAAEFADD